MRTVVVAALIGGVLGALLCGIVGADFNSGLAPPDMKAQQALEGSALWAVVGFIVGTLVGAGVAAVVRGVRRNAALRNR